MRRCNIFGWIYFIFLFIFYFVCYQKKATKNEQWQRLICCISLPTLDAVRLCVCLFVYWSGYLIRCNLVRTRIKIYLKEDKVNEKSSETKANKNEIELNGKKKLTKRERRASDEDDTIRCDWKRWIFTWIYRVRMVSLISAHCRIPHRSGNSLYLIL